MGLSVEVTHRDTYALLVNDPALTVVAETRHQALAQALMTFLVEFNPAAYVPTAEDCERMVADPSLIPVGAIEIPTEEVLPPQAVADADDAAPGMMDYSEAVTR